VYKTNFKEVVMALESVYKCSRTIEKLRTGPIGPVQDRFCEWLSNQGYTRHTIQVHLESIFYLNDYLAKAGLNDYSRLMPEHICAFERDHFKRHKSSVKGLNRHRRITCSINRFTQYLKQYEGVQHFPFAQSSTPPLVDEYLRWLKEVRHLAVGTIELRRGYLTRFIQSFNRSLCPEKLFRLSSADVQSFFLWYAKHHGKAARRSMQAALRTFFRFCRAQGYIPLQPDLAASVPTLRTYKLDTLPRGLTDEQVRTILSHIDRKTDAGKRDYAIIQLLSTYGVRGGQVRALRFEDIHWRQNRIHFSPLKNGKGIFQPLTNEVGEALVDYLQHTRVKISSYRYVFLTVRAPYRPLKYSTTLSEIVASRIKAAGIKTHNYGSHNFRHGFATRMLAKGHPLKAIADMIGHRCIQTTALYTKVDFKTLNLVPLDLPPEVIS
jgi:site-specific recombinase XerD